MNGTTIGFPDVRNDGSFVPSTTWETDLKVTILCSILKKCAHEFARPNLISQVI
jgi:hypothetical protein